MFILTTQLGLSCKLGSVVIQSYKFRLYGVNIKKSLRTIELNKTRLIFIRNNVSQQTWFK